MDQSRRVMDNRAHRFTYTAERCAGGIRYQVADSLSAYSFPPERFESHARAICDGLNTLHYCGVLPALLAGGTE